MSILLAVSHAYSSTLQGALRVSRDLFILVILFTMCFYQNLTNYFFLDIGNLGIVKFMSYVVYCLYFLIWANIVVSCWNSIFIGLQNTSFWKLRQCHVSQILDSEYRYNNLTQNTAEFIETKEEKLTQSIRNSVGRGSIGFGAGDSEYEELDFGDGDPLPERRVTVGSSRKSKELANEVTAVK